VFEFLAFRHDIQLDRAVRHQSARECPTIRDYISREMWEDINSLYSREPVQSGEEMAAGSPLLRCHPFRQPPVSRRHRRDVAA